MKLLGINISHNTSICFYIDKKITNLYEESRFNKTKNFIIKENDSFLISLDEKLNFVPDVVCYSSFGRINNKDYKIIKKIQRQLNNPKYYFDIDNHHLYHATCGFYFSKYDEAMAIVIDGGGAHDYLNPGYQEMESIFYISKEKIKKKYQHKSNRRFCLSDKNVIDYSPHNFIQFNNGVENHYSSQAVGGYMFSVLCKLIGLNEDDAGKAMGLASYSKSDKNFNLDKSKVDLCQKVQDMVFEKTCLLIEKAFSYKKIKNIILSGGYFQNCTNNFRYVKKYPDLNFFVDPIPTDSGTSAGACIYYENYL